MQLTQDEMDRLDKVRMQNAENAEFMDAIFSIASKYNVFTDEDLTALTTEMSHQLFGRSTKPVLLEITGKDEETINKMIRDEYGNRRPLTRYYRKPEYIFHNRVFLATNNMYGKYKDGEPCPGDNRTPLYEWFMEKICQNDEENSSEMHATERNRKEEEGGRQLSTKETLEAIKNYIAAKGFTFDEGLVENYYLSLKSKPFVILAGTSGTGKTRLVRLFAEAIGATTQNGRYKLVPVRPDWSDSSDLLGHVNLNDKFIPGAIIDFLKLADGDKRHPYFLCLDEMNLARVEYYLSDLLSVIETREYVDGEIITDPLITEKYYGSDSRAREKYGILRIPENLYIIGTVNMDETTFPFSKKVLDRANTIEFSTVELQADFEPMQGNAKAVLADNSFLKAEYVFFNQCAPDKEFVEDVCVELQKINRILEKANAHVGYRVRDEIVFYMLSNKNSDNLLTINQAFDHEIMQKILPRIQGSSVSTKLMLCELFKYCAGDYEGYQTESDDVGAKMMAAANKSACKYKESAKKIAYMVRRFEEDGFTAYWL